MSSTQNISLRKQRPIEVRKYILEQTGNIYLKYFCLYRYAFQAFGQGPRACIGMRFALLEAKVAFLSVLQKYSFKPGTKTIEPLVINGLGWAKGGLWAKVELRD